MSITDMHESDRFTDVYSRRKCHRDSGLTGTPAVVRRAASKIPQGWAENFARQ